MCNCQGKCKVCHCGKQWVVGIEEGSFWKMQESKNNIVVFECDNCTEATEVAEKCTQRGDMKAIKILNAMPTFNSSMFHVSYKTKADALNMYGGQPC